MGPLAAINRVIGMADAQIVRQSTLANVLAERSNLFAEKTALDLKAHALSMQRDALMAERDALINRPALAISKLENLVPQYQMPLMRSQFALLAQVYDAADGPSEREAVSRHVMTRVLLEPVFAKFVEDDFAGATMKHILADHIRAAASFARGDLQKCRNLFSSLPLGTFNQLCLARTLLAEGNLRDAGQTLNSGLAVFPDDLYLTMELATLRYHQGQVDAANELAARMIDRFAAEQTAIAELQNEIDHALRTGIKEKLVTRDIYTDDFVTDTWWFYWRCYNSFNEFQHGNAALESGIQREVGKLLSSTLSDATTFIDFGAFCGYTIWKLAELYPKVHFIGVDRPKIAKVLNDQAFERPNVEFIAGDMIEFLQDRGSFGPRPVLFHSRTAVFCYPAFLQQLYGLCASLGINDVVFQEGSTFFSRHFLKFFALGGFPQVSMAGRGSTFMHDYYKLLAGENYRIASAADIRPKLLLDDQSGFGAHHQITHATRR